MKEKAVVLGVSPDGVTSHEKFITKKELPFGLISDEDHGLSEAHGVWVEKKNFGKTYMGVERSSFVYDESGKLSAILEKVKPAEHLELLLSELN